MKRVLFIIPFENLYPPMSGGMQRGINLLHQLSMHFEVTAIIGQDRNSFLQACNDYPALKNCTILSKKEGEKPVDIFSLLPQKLSKAFRYRYWNRSLKGPAGDDFLSIYPIVKDLLKHKEFDCAILEDQSLINIAKVIRRYQPNVRIVYDAYNVNTVLAESALASGQITEKVYEVIKADECNLSTLVDDVFTCSDQDLLQLIEMNKGKLKGAVIPNGVNIPKYEPRTEPIPADIMNNILFCGSLDYLPNQEGLAWFCREIFPLILQQKPSTRLLVVGKGKPDEELSRLLKGEAIIYYGMVDKVSDYYKKAAVAVIPLLSGSGTRLKLLEAMGNRVAVVSTSVGAEGITYTDKKNILIADDKAAFARGIIELSDHKEMADKMAEEAFSFVENTYDWNIIGRKIPAYLNGSNR